MGFKLETMLQKKKLIDEQDKKRHVYSDNIITGHLRQEIQITETLPTFLEGHFGLRALQRRRATNYPSLQS
jgi:hypothetical protein